jgi:hypothetical protein
MERGELEVLLVLLRAVVPAREREDQGVVALELAQLSRHLRVIRQLVVRERTARDDVRAHRGNLRSSRGLLRLGLLPILSPSRKPT